MNNIPFYFGIVEYRFDPEQLGRCKVRVFGVHSENKEELPTQDLPWCYPAFPINNAAMSGIGTGVTGVVEGTQVIVFFRDGEDMQEPMMIATIPGKYDKKPSYSEGFSDPTGKYPVFDVDKNDVNRLERGIIEKTHVDFKTQNLTSAKTTSDISPTGERIESSWEEMFETSPQYPFNHVKETESGHIEEYDDTPGFERTHRMHRSGTSEEIYAGGDRTLKVYGDNYEIVVEDNNIAIYGKCNITIGENANILVGGNANLEVNGSLSTIVHGNENRIIKGNLTERVVGNISRIAGGSIQDMGESVNIHASGNLITRAGGYNYVQASGNVELQGSLVHLNKPTALVPLFNAPALASTTAMTGIISPTGIADYSPRRGQTLARTYISIAPEATVVFDDNGNETVESYPEGFVYPISIESSTERDEIIRRVIRREGGYVNNKNDTGGATKYGITIGTLANYRGVPKASLTPSDVKKLTEEEAIAIYKKNYWDNSRMDEVSDTVRELFFDTHVHGGAAVVARRALNSLGYNIPTSGGISASLVEAMNSVNQKQLFDAMVKERVKRFYGIVQNNPSQKVFINGWLNRMKDFGWSTSTA